MYFFHQISNPLHMFHCILGLSRPDDSSLDEKGEKMPSRRSGGEDEKDIFGWQEMVRDSLTHYSVAWMKLSHGAKSKEFTFQLFVLTKAK